ncbi:MAG: hypothetical protein QOF17_1398, partial [Solirubrobacteraceae bacterium]|nr:hypothetical protein [Solirubrobacteraceae bacterium]
MLRVARDGGPAAEQALSAQLVTPEGRRDPRPILRDADLPGCRHAVAERMLRPRFTPPGGQAFEGPMGEMLSPLSQQIPLQTSGICRYVL